MSAETIVANLEHVLDTIRFELAVEKTVIQEWVTLQVDVTAINQTKDIKRDSQDAMIKEALKKFVPDAKWEFYSVRRFKEALGFERLMLKAIAKVHAREDMNLEERAREASSEGLSLSNPVIDNSLPKEVIGATMKELGEETFLLVNERAETFSRLTGRQWRIGEIIFAPKDVRTEDYNPKRMYIEERETESLLRAGHVKLVSRVVLKSNYAPVNAA